MKRTRKATILFILFFTVNPRDFKLNDALIAGSSNVKFTRRVSKTGQVYTTPQNIRCNYKLMASNVNVGRFCMNAGNFFRFV